MRLIHIFAALSGALALSMLAIGSHAVAPEDASRMQIAGFVQLAAAVMGVTLAPRAGRVSAVAGTMILAGAALFAGALYVTSLMHAHGFGMLAPVGGLSMIAGWVVLAFARPRA